MLSVYCHVVHRVIGVPGALALDALVRLEESRLKIDPEAMKVNGLSRDILSQTLCPRGEQVTFKLRRVAGTLYVSLQAARDADQLQRAAFRLEFPCTKGFRLAKLQVPSWLRFADAKNVIQQLVPGEMLQLPINPQTGRRIQKQVTVFHQLTPISYREAAPFSQGGHFIVGDHLADWARQDPASTRAPRCWPMCYRTETVSRRAVSTTCYILSKLKASGCRC